jgi:hypothetical protein
MERTPVMSSVIEEVGYNRSTRTLEILFKSGAIHLYDFVPQEAYDGLMAAEAKGTYFHRHIKAEYQSHRIADADGPPEKPATCNN